MAMDESGGEIIVEEEEDILEILSDTECVSDFDDEEKYIDDEISTVDDDGKNSDDEEDFDDDIEEGEKDTLSLRKKRITLPILTKYERSKILSIRSQQIMDGSAVFVDCSKMEKPTPYSIALEELKQKKTPFKVRRKMLDGTYEIWSITDFFYIF